MAGSSSRYPNYSPAASSMAASSASAAPATPAQIEKAIGVLTVYESAAIERLGMILDSATLAVEQVQDKRLEALETKDKQVSFSDVVLDVVLGILLESPMVADTVKQMTQSVLGQLLRLNTVYKLLPKSNYGEELLELIKDEVDAKEVSAVLSAILRDNLSSRSKFSKREYALYSREVVSWVTKVSDKSQLTAAGVKSAAAAAKRMIDTPKPNGEAGQDTPGVGVLRTVQEYVAAHRHAIRAQNASIAALFRSQVLTADQLVQFLQFVMASELPDDPRQTRDAYKLMFEAVIWARLYRFDSEDSAPKIVPNYAIIGQLTSFDGIPDELAIYWRRRFRAVLAKFDRAADLSPIGLTQTLRHYFVKISQEVRSYSEQLFSISPAKSFVVIDVDPTKDP